MATAPDVHALALESRSRIVLEVIAETSRTKADRGSRPCPECKVGTIRWYCGDTSTPNRRARSFRLYCTTPNCVSAMS